MDPITLILPFDKTLISCLCVTYGRVELLKRAIDCFNNQSYDNKQLIIVYLHNDDKTRSFLLSNNLGSNIKGVEVGTSEKKISLGELRNISVREADGEYICQWDDDDWYDPDRLKKQLDELLRTGKSAVVLARLILFNTISKKSYISFPHLWEGSLLCKKDVIIQKPYPPLSHGEDTCIIDYLNKCGNLCVIDSPTLYVYVIHGRNTCDDKHFDNFFFKSRELPDDFNKDVLDILDDYKKHYEKLD